MLKIRLQRVGRKNDPSFRFVLTDSHNSTKSGRAVEVLGHFDFRKDSENKIDADRVKHWISVGAKPTPTVHNYLVAQKIVSGKKVNVLPRKSPPKKEEPPVVPSKEEAPKDAKAAPAAGAAAEAPKA